jgi:hypothetical protein
MFLAILFSSALVLAQVESSPIPMNPKPDFSKMAFMMGTWTCSTMSSRRPGAYMTTVTNTMSPDGYWMIQRSMVHKASWIPRSFMSEDRITYDPSTSRWIDLNMDEQGGYNVSWSPGWTGNTIKWTDAVITKQNATASTNPTVTTRVSDTKTTSKSSFREPSGRLVNVTTTCTKSKTAYNH